MLEICLYLYMDAPVWSQLDFVLLQVEHASQHHMEKTAAQSVASFNNVTHRR